MTSTKVSDQAVNIDEAVNEFMIKFSTRSVSSWSSA